MTPKQFKSLQNQWYKKLARSGFKDIENSNLPSIPLKRWGSEFKHSYAIGTFEEHRRYYELAGQLLHGHTFQSPLDKKIWQHHCQGVGVTDIGDKLGMSRFAIRRVIKRYEGFIKRGK